MEKNSITNTIAVPALGIRFYYSAYLCAAAFPFIFNYSQLLLGTAINFILITAALNAKNAKVAVPLIFLPGLATLGKGFLFGPFTPLLLYMLPLIWVGNGLLFCLLRPNGVLKKWQMFPRLLAGASAKSAVLFLGASGWVSAGILPPVFKTSMGMIQFITALLGGFAALALLMATTRAAKD